MAAHDGRTIRKPNFGHSWASGYGCIWTSKSVHFGNPHLPNLGSHIRPTWKPISIHVGSPLLSILGTHSYPRWVSNFVHNGSPCLSTMGIQTHPSWKPISIHGGCPLLPTLGVHTSPQWASKSTQVGSPSLSTKGVHFLPHWESTPLHNGHPNPPKLKAHLHPRRVSTSAHTGNPILVSGRPKAAKIWKPIHDAWTSGSCRSWAANPCTRAPTYKGWMPKKDSATHPEQWTPTCPGGHATCTQVDAHAEWWASSPEMWVPMVARGHTKRNAWTRMDAHIYAWAHVWKGQKKSSLP